MADVPWSEYTGELIDDLDSQIGKKYKMSIKAFLLNPIKFVGRENVQTTISNIREESNKTIDGMLDSLKDERSALQDNLSKADSATSQLSQNISLQAKQNRTPMIKPVLIERNEDEGEVVYVDAVDAGVLALVEKLVKDAAFIADYTAVYKEHKIGAWLFSSAKDYMLRVYLPPNEVLLLEGSKDEINALFDMASNLIK